MQCRSGQSAHLCMWGVSSSNQWCVICWRRAEEYNIYGGAGRCMLTQLIVPKWLEWCTWVYIYQWGHICVFVQPAVCKWLTEECTYIHRSGRKHPIRTSGLQDAGGMQKSIHTYTRVHRMIGGRQRDMQIFPKYNAVQVVVIRYSEEGESVHIYLWECRDVYLTSTLKMVGGRWRSAYMLMRLHKYAIIWSAVFRVDR